MAHRPCYMCDRPGTTKEHVPPRCLFPEPKDLDGHRRNLITVPSCEQHNSGKSADDEFLMASLAGIIGGNAVGLFHKLSKVSRAMRRTSFSLLDKALKDRTLEVVEYAPNQFIDVIWGTPDYDRLFACFDKIARGLYLSHFGKKLVGGTKPMLGFLQNLSPNAAEFQRFVRDKVAVELKDKPSYGDNPDVFSFQFADQDQFGLHMAHLRFYGGLSVYVTMMPDGFQMPGNLAMHLIDGGIPTTITLGESEYHFNYAEGETPEPIRSAISAVRATRH